MRIHAVSHCAAIVEILLKGVTQNNNKHVIEAAMNNVNADDTIKAIGKLSLNYHAEQRAFYIEEAKRKIVK